MTKPRIPAAGIAVTLAAALAVVAGLITLGSPSHARERRLDEMRVQDLTTLSSALDQYWANLSTLPDSLDSLVSKHQLDRLPKDPSTNARYTYVASGGRSYRLCATFNQPTDTSDAAPRPSIVFGPIPRSWRHGKGESCFDLTPPTKDAK